MNDEAKFSDYPVDTRLALLHQDNIRLNSDVEKLTDKVSDLEKSDAVMKEQIGTVSTSIGEIKETQKMIVEKLDKKQEEDLKESKQMKYLLIGTTLTSVASLIGFFITNFLTN